MLVVNRCDYSQEEVEDCFEKKGYKVEVEQKHKANQLSLTNFWMAKELF